MKYIKVVCFDVDGTLTVESSWKGLSEGLGIPGKVVYQNYLDAATGKITFREGERLLLKMFLETGNATRENIKRIFESIDLRPEAYEIMNYLKKKGYPIYLISGAIDTYVEIVAERLGVTGHYSNADLEYDKNGLLTKINYRDEQGKLKLEQVKELLKKYKIDREQLTLIGNGTNDIEVFNYTGRGISVYADEKSVDKAAWKTVKDLTEIKEIL